MENLRNFNIHKFHNIPDLEDVYYPFVVFEYVSNYPFKHFITAPSLNEALQSIYEIVQDEYHLDDDSEGPELSAEMVIIDENDIIWYNKLNYE